MEIRTKLDVCDIQFGDNGNAFITFNEEPGNIVNQIQPLLAYITHIVYHRLYNNIKVNL